MSGTWIVLYVVLWVAVAVLVVLVMGLTRRVGDLTSHREALAKAQLGFPVTAANDPRSVSLRQGDDFYAVQASLASPYAANLVVPDEARTTLILFLSSGCGPCVTVGEELSTPEGQVQSPSLRLVLVTDEHGQSEFSGLLADQVVVQKQHDVSARFGIKASPFAIVLSSAGLVTATGIPNSRSDIQGLVAASSLEPSKP